MQFTWDERKRLSNLTPHGIDFIDAPRVFEGPTFTLEDNRFNYDETHYVTLGFLSDVAVSTVHRETPGRIHVILFRKAIRYQEIILFENIED